MIYEDIPEFKAGSVVFLISDLSRKTPMTVVSDKKHEEEVYEFVDNIDWLAVNPFEPNHHLRRKTGEVKNDDW